jgi:lipopolysaccharide biosynthesis glycosyltransferase
MFSNVFADDSKEVHIAISFDQGYVTFVYVLLTSVFLNNSGNTMVVHALAPDVLKSEYQGLIDFAARHNSRLIFYQLSPEATNNFALPNHEGAYLSLASYYRLFFAQLVPHDLEKLLYIDVDTLVIGNLREIYQSDLQGHVIGAVKEGEMPPRPELGITNMDDYFNAGVLLIDLPKWREQEITKKASYLAVHYPEKVREYADQDALNMVFCGEWQRLSPRFNLMKAYIPHDLPKQEFARFLADKVLIHYNGPLKPWHRASDNRFRYLYPLYLQKSPRAGTARYVKKKLTKVGLSKLLFSRALEVYFNYPEVGNIWRRLKYTLGK